MTRPVSPHPRGHGHGEITSSAGDIEDLMTLAQVGLGDGPGLPDPMQPNRHEVVHEVVPLGDRVKDLANMPGLFCLGDRAKPKMGVCH